DGDDPSVFQVLKMLVEDPEQGPRMFRAGHSPEQIVTSVISETPLKWKILARQDLRFQCPCSRSRVAGMLGMLSTDELEEMVAQDGGAEVTCRFCNERYRLDGDELQLLIARISEVN
ncbi:MAG: Hsp33 family molecular chaperone HslO, partial [Nitrospinae bacterium]|nr:Hsp33 family molecular chaperone HslO [Nitrospinota bacterium]